MIFRNAEQNDIESIVNLLAADPLGSTRERPDPATWTLYQTAFKAISDDQNNQLLVADIDGDVVAVLQLTFIPNMTYKGSWRAQIEGVRVAESERGKGLGRALVKHAVELSKIRRCRMVQLTTDKRRPKAISFYEELGFKATHEGMKMLLDTDGEPE